MTQTEPTPREANRAAIRRRISHHTIALITTPPGEGRREICAAIRDLEQLLKLLS